MADEPVTDVRERLGSLIDDLWDRPCDVCVDISAEDEAIEVGGLVQERLSADPSLAAVMLRLDKTHDVGPVTRRSLAVAEGLAGSGGAETAVGDGAELPGRSTRFRVIEFSCPDCHARVLRSYYDERCLPLCPDHGVMELVR
ncbi:hypothetical protein [Yinghuangia seranimata]|uniref:hypothetical protein n=1 Tax=Yinghuangia seranimata TaxID=408067 RepID=UPI00248AF6D1|nr:hypothetical protein [Yinghuangia seranimata]MDI2132796.1 hypothetical protein [Yinghuangia seranimata]